MFYRVLQEKRAGIEGNYYSPHLSDKLRRSSFDEANQRRADRALGESRTRRFGAIAGGIGGGLMGLGAMHEMGGKGLLPLAAAGLGAGAGYGVGYLADKARDARTLEAREIMKMSPRARADLLSHRSAERADFHDETEDRSKWRERDEESRLREERIRELRSRRYERASQPRSVYVRR